MEGAAKDGGQRQHAVQPRLAAERDLARTAEEVFEQMALRRIRAQLELYPAVQGLVLSGGCALNVLLNMRAQRELGYPVYVPSAPNDGGLSIGALWMAQPPPPAAPHSPLAFLGPRLWDAATLPQLAAQHGALRVDVEEVARLLAEGRIVAVVRGRAEVGPRALGHRSLLAAPLAEVKARLNRLKFREYWRPVAPMVAAEATSPLGWAGAGGWVKGGHTGGPIFQEGFWSPYMSFAPKLVDGADAHWPAVGAQPVASTELHHSGVVFRTLGRALCSWYAQACSDPL